MAVGAAPGTNPGAGQRSILATLCPRRQPGVDGRGGRVDRRLPLRQRHHLLIRRPGFRPCCRRREQHGQPQILHVFQMNGEFADRIVVALFRRMWRGGQRLGPADGEPRVGRREDAGGELLSAAFQDGDRPLRLQPHPGLRMHEPPDLGWRDRV